MSKYRVINGRLCDQTGKPVPLEFGNWEQINFIKNQIRLIEEFNGDGVEVDVVVNTKYIFEADFACVCGATIYAENEADDEDDIDCLHNTMKTCNKCKESYILKVNANGKLTAKTNREMGEM